MYETIGEFWNSVRVPMIFGDGVERLSVPIPTGAPAPLTGVTLIASAGPLAVVPVCRSIAAACQRRAIFAASVRRPGRRRSALRVLQSRGARSAGSKGMDASRDAQDAWAAPGIRRARFAHRLLFYIFNIKTLLLYLILSD